MSLVITIPNYETVDGHIEYMVKVQGTLEGAWHFRKRYSLIREFHEQLKHVFPQIPHFPPKKVFGNKQPAFLAQRKAALEQYFSALSATAEVRQNPNFLAFIKPMDAVILSTPQPVTPRTTNAPPHRPQPASNNVKQAEQQMNRIAEEVSVRFINLSTVPSPLDEEDVGRKRQEYAKEIDQGNVTAHWKLALPVSKGEEETRRLANRAKQWMEEKCAVLQEAVADAEVQGLTIVVELNA